jgi:hypothetical protein
MTQKEQEKFEAPWDGGITYYPLSARSHAIMHRKLQLSRQRVSQLIKVLELIESHSSFFSNNGYLVPKTAIELAREAIKMEKACN